jgi:hypothetical protein
MLNFTHPGADTCTVGAKVFEGAVEMVLELLRMLLGSRLVTLPVGTHPTFQSHRPDASHDWPEGDLVAWTDAGLVRSQQLPAPSRIV